MSLRNKTFFAGLMCVLAIICLCDSIARSYLDMARDNRPYAVNGRPVMFGEIATHGNAHAIALDPAKELKSLRIECRGTETFVGLLAATLYR